MSAPGPFPIREGTHDDLLLAVAARPPRRRAGSFRERWLPQLREGGVDLQVLPVFIEDAFRPAGTLRMIERAHPLAEGNADEVRLCLEDEDIGAALAEGGSALVLALESAPGIDADVELFATVHRPGVRVASLAHRGVRGSPTAAARTRQAAARPWRPFRRSPRRSGWACSSTSPVSAPRASRPCSPPGRHRPPAPRPAPCGTTRT